MGKSAQFFLHTWLPDAMEGPTPVSALIHAATMVTAGVFMVCAPVADVRARADGAGRRRRSSAPRPRSSPRPSVSSQNDIKRVIAYSTCSQLGYMFVARWASAPIGVGDVPPVHPRLLQGAAVPRRRLGHPRACTTSRTCARWAACAKQIPLTCGDARDRHAGAHRLGIPA